MEILNLRPSPGSGNTVARFDAEIAPGVRAYGLRLVNAKNGYRVFGPSVTGGSAITFAPAVADALIELYNGEVAQNEPVN